MSPELERFIEDCRADACRADAWWREYPEAIEIIEAGLVKLYRRGDEEPGVQADVDRICEIISRKGQTLMQRMVTLAEFLLGVPGDPRN
jgi:hypothetical protein